jgi:hypothetical protein
MDLKIAASEAFIKLLEPARKHFENPAHKAALKEMEKMTITR